MRRADTAISLTPLPDPLPRHPLSRQLVLKIFSSSSSSSAANYYANIKSKWVEEYPSSETIADDTWSFYYRSVEI